MLVTWFLDVDGWTPSKEDWQRLLSYVPQNEVNLIERYRFVKDQKFALCSRLLQRKLIHQVHGVDYQNIRIERTGKPFWVDCTNARWNYNVSHQGSIVAIACHDLYRIGIDVVCITDKSPKLTIDQFFKNFTLYFGSREWAQIHSSPNPLECFYQLWSLKEAYVKALGIGIGFDISRVQFDLDNGIDFYLDDQLTQTWQFITKQLNPTHYISIAMEIPLHERLNSIEWIQLDTHELDRL
ncbi:L-aminoadipate-semialdehyde dehydrogenase-phosphopantetheinyl transferase [Thraustotheca clavata]|uniref:holo-[acyl-carrier-protein] synthase n=1 Tax=Thraustotheca clavata TaxID=74557 RepID=A0A1V9ZMA5_9STRA|nr:L-aminoadipate-semialdehyde dehydrogenase-phosphopantetheinyl transferase [Thraustotheca clavata]